MLEVVLSYLYIHKFSLCGLQRVRELLWRMLRQGKKKYRINIYLRNTSILHLYLQFLSVQGKYTCDVSCRYINTNSKLRPESTLGLHSSKILLLLRGAWP